MVIGISFILYSGRDVTYTIVSDPPIDSLLETIDILDNIGPDDIRAVRVREETW